MRTSLPAGGHAPPRSQAELNRDRSKAVATWCAISLDKPWGTLRTCCFASWRLWQLS